MTDSTTEANDSTEQTFDEYAANTRYFDARNLLDYADANHHGLTRISAEPVKTLTDSPRVRISRASSSGDHRNLDADEARQMARELRELDERDSILLHYFTGGYRDDPHEMADALEAGAETLEAAERLDDDLMEMINEKVHEVGDDA